MAPFLATPQRKEPETSKLLLVLGDRLDLGRLSAKARSRRATSECRRLGMQVALRGREL